MAITTTAYRRMSSQPRIIFSVSRIFKLLAIVAFALSSILKVDLMIRAPGLVVAAESTRPITTSVNGILESFEVTDGQRVAVGDTLVILSDFTTTSRIESAEKSIKGLWLQKLADLALLKGQSEEEFSEALKQAELKVDDEMIQRWILSYRTRKNLHLSLIKKFESSADILEAELEALSKGSLQLKRLAALLEERNEKVQDLVSRGLSTDFASLDSKVSMAEIQERMMDNAAQLLLKRAERQRLDVEMSSYLALFRNQLVERIVSVSEQISLSEIELNRLREKEEQLLIKAPINGIVQEIAMASLKQQTNRSPLLTIVPTDRKMYVIASIKNQDIRNIGPGNKAELLFDAYPLALYGTSQATIETITEDIAGITNTIPVPVNVVSLRAYFNEYQKVSTHLTYVAKMTVDEAQNPKIKLRPGLSVMANIKIGEQRVIMFFLNPIVRAWHSTLKEQ